ncbi:hypothetical protein C8A05DRAFT_48065 [Staphylotrichum tortipilum]|uniref:Uncharacterized protein n=1 Tax=Staphylotrichum tortipilum TaxID=2831512 RepID=A0AAN6RNR9_9PEZI|nr:hypothetical protein C8A05DRAFT_48065 [Staphylotrichum longicolle]
MSVDCWPSKARSLSYCDPRLKNSVFSLSRAPNKASPGKKWTPWRKARPRVLALHLNLDGSCKPSVEYADASLLATHLKQQAYNYLLESLSRDFIDVFGEHLQLHPSVFMDLEKLAPVGDHFIREGGGLPFLPSAVHGREHVSIKYHEPRELSRLPTDFRNICDTSGRTIAVTRLMGEFTNVGICRRKCTFWAKGDASGGWTCLIICDPPTRRILSDHRDEGHDVRTWPYGFGYLDFMPLSRQIDVRRGPPRSSMLADLSFYIQNHASALNLSHPYSLRVFVEKLDLTSFDVAAAEELWSDIQAWERRMGEYHDDISGAMVQLGVPLGHHAGSDLKGQGQGFADTAADFQFLRLRFQQVAERVHALAGAISALAGLAGNRAAARAAELSLKEAEQARRQARSLKALTVLGVVFLPLSFAAGILSMAELFLPGGGMFWVYFGVALPLLGLVTLVYVLAEVGYRDGEVKWSVVAVMERLRGMWE